MDAETIKRITAKGEGLTLEFKESTNDVSGSVYETICSFLNHSGGEIVLGVKDNGEIIGVNKNAASDLVKNIINTVNNPELFSPRTVVYPEICPVDEKVVIYIYIQPSSSVHQYKKKFYDRNGDADNDVSQDFGLLSNVFSRKTTYSSESRLIPQLKIEDLDKETFEKCRKLAAVLKPTHPWLTMTDEEILRSAKLFVRDPKTGEEGICLAGLLLFGTEESMMSFFPIYRIEAIYRNKTYNYYLKNDIQDTTRYDDRVTERGNLIQAYYTLNNFVERHLPDKFYLEEGNAQRQDIRLNIFREVIANLEVHREYSNPRPGMFEIFSDRVVVSNWSKLAMGEKSGIVSIDELHTYPKNPLLVNVFRQLGWVEELGSGFRNIKKYAPAYYADAKIEIENNEWFVFSMTYQHTRENSVKEGENIPSSVNGCENKIDIKDGSVNENQNNIRHLFEDLISENINGIADKIAKRMADELMAIHASRHLTKEELKSVLKLSDEQIRIDLRELTKRRLLDQKGKDKQYVLSEKSIKKLSGDKWSALNQNNSL